MNPSTSTPVHLSPRNADCRAWASAPSGPRRFGAPQSDPGPAGGARRPIRRRRRGSSTLRLCSSLPVHPRRHRPEGGGGVAGGQRQAPRHAIAPSSPGHRHCSHRLRVDSCGGLSCGQSALIYGTQQNVDYLSRIWADRTLLSLNATTHSIRELGWRGGWE